MHSSIFLCPFFLRTGYTVRASTFLRTERYFWQTEYFLTYRYSKTRYSTLKFQFVKNLMRVCFALVCTPELQNAEMEHFPRKKKEVRLASSKRTSLLGSASAVVFRPKLAKKDNKNIYEKILFLY
jgi:hypothetical protein